jgi:pimeloyl-ACP methyl ester carboxylesterase
MPSTTTWVACALSLVAVSGCGSDDATGSAPGGDEIHPVDRSGLADVGTSGPLDYANPALWVCRRGNDPNGCHKNLDATEIKADGTLAVVPHERAQNPSFDCFYVYPTVLLTGAPQMTDFTEEGIARVYDPLLTQGARFSRICEVYAPLYRQTGLSGGRPVAGANSELALQDVRDAFAYYLEHLNRGRDFVLIGHSQGTFMLTGMMQKDIDNNPELRKRLISALLIGGRIEVPAGKRVGGTFQNIPTCSAPGETGCVLAYVSYSAQAPPTATSLFGLAGAGNEAACVEPALLAGNSGAYQGSYFQVAVANPSFAADVPPRSDVSTPFLLYRNTFDGQCVTRDTFRYLEYTLLSNESDPRGIPPWRHTTIDGLGFGTHLVDFHIPLDDLIETVAQQAGRR